MLIADKDEILAAISLSEVIDEMRRAVVAQSRGDCETPMPMHLTIPAEDAEIHIKSGYCRGGPYFALKMATGFPRNAARGRPAGNGVLLLSSAETGEPAALLNDEAALTDVRTAAVSAMLARELGRADTALGILGTGVQARWQARLHAEVLDLREIWLWGRTPSHAESCAAELRTVLPKVRIGVAENPAAVARRARLIITATPSRQPLLRREDVHAGTLVSAVGADARGKQELDAAILEAATLLLVDSLAQCEHLGELQHARHLSPRAVEIGKFCDARMRFDPAGIVVADFTGLGVEDLFVGAYCCGRLAARRGRPSPRG
jgi:ornithine cyclodeaminase/alanine dehydrogenase-like protein (mu-crystallin family)